VATYATDAEVGDALEDALGETTLATRHERVVTRANVQAYNLIRRRLAARGFSPSQMDDWDDASEFNVQIGKLFALRSAAMAGGNYDLNALQMEWEYYLKELDDGVFLIDGEPQIPEGDAPTVARGDMRHTDAVFPDDLEDAGWDT
jgi:hypothetical protein